LGKITALAKRLKRLISVICLFISRPDGFVERRKLLRVESLLLQRFFDGSRRQAAGSNRDLIPIKRDWILS